MNPPDPPHPRRPTRLDRVFAELPPLYFVTFNTYRRAHLLANEAVHATFVEFCRRAESLNIAVGRYVLMPDHIHLFVALPEVGNVTLGGWVKSLKAVLGKTLLTLNVDKPHWQEGFFDHLLRSAESESQKWDYVRMNPVRAGLCRAPEDWPYQGEIIRL